MKQELKRKCLPPSYYPKLLDKWNTLTQGSKPVKDYISAFDDFLICCNGEESATPTQILSMFRAGLREDLRTELFARGVDSLEAACSLVLDLEDSKTHSQTRHFDSRSNSYRTSSGLPDAGLLPVVELSPDIYLMLDLCQLLDFFLTPSF
ncbi:hypothetical protein KFK09_013455 [Dendrobium nobile]|uniref:Retrotransposon gag domain-containing protein n=1 Tax=Dendrobium nobile TaxID=94219 RepID=A0A8T3B7E4_DENNO|nr:hypothetical protein KFK09_013455 [Dendrobium nobile]